MHGVNPNSEYAEPWDLGQNGDWLANRKKSLQICFSGLPCLRSPSIGSNLGVDEIWLLRRSGCPAKMAHSDIGVVPQFKSLLQPLSISPDFWKNPGSTNVYQICRHEFRLGSCLLSTPAFWVPRHTPMISILGCSLRIIRYGWNKKRVVVVGLFIIIG